MIRRRILCILLALCACVLSLHAGVFAADGTIAVNGTNFPDEVFRIYVTNHCDTDRNGFLDAAEIQKVTSISLYQENVGSLKGIEYFSALTSLTCPVNQLTELDVSRNSALTYLECWENPLGELDVSKNLALIYLNCSGCDLSALDVSKNTALTYLDCSANNLGSLNVSANTALETLICSYCELNDLDVSQNTSLKTLRCWSNHLTTLDVRSCTLLETLEPMDNPLTGLDVSQNPELKSLECGSCGLTELDVSQNLALEQITCNNNRLTALDLSQNTALSFGNLSDQEGTIRLKKLPGNQYTADIGALVPDASRVTLAGQSATDGSYDTNTGIATFSACPDTVSYDYTTGSSCESDIGDPREMRVNLSVEAVQSVSMTYSTTFTYLEPWALRFAAALKLDGEVIPVSEYTDYGVYILRTDDATAPSSAQLMESGTRYSPQNSDWETFTFDAVERVRMAFAENLWTYELDKHIYVMFYIEYDGNVYYGSVKDRQELAILESIRDSGTAGSTTFGKAEQALVKAILDLFAATKDYRESISMT